MCCCCVSLFLCCSCLVSILFLSLPHSLWFSLCFSLFSLFSVCTSHSELRTYGNKVPGMLLHCCISFQVYHTKYHTAVSYTVDRASQMVDCCIIPVLSLFVCDSSCSNAFPFVLCRYHCRYHRCKDVGRVATVHIPSMPVRLYHCQYVGRVTRYCCTYISRPSQHVRMIS